MGTKTKPDATSELHLIKVHASLLGVLHCPAPADAVSGVVLEFARVTRVLPMVGRCRVRFALPGLVAVAGPIGREVRCPPSL